MIYNIIHLIWIKHRMRVERAEHNEEVRVLEVIIRARSRSGAYSFWKSHYKLPASEQIDYASAIKIARGYRHERAYQKKALSLEAI